MKKIELSQGMFAFVDDDDYDYLNQYNWCFNKGYATRNVKVSGKQKTQNMHRLVTNCPDGLFVDHINHDKLDNQKSNLRVCSRSENNQNQQKRTIAKSSRFKGVYFAKHANKWMAYIRFNYKLKNLGYFTNEIDAAIAYNNAAIEMFGEFALINDVR